MTKAPELTPELRAKLETRYNTNRTIAVFIVYVDHYGKLTIEWFPNVSHAYDFRYDMIASGLGYTAEEFLVVNTFKEFESGD